MIKTGFSLRRLWRDRNRTSWLWCPECHHDLNGDNESFVAEVDEAWIYDCANCDRRSVFDLRFPVPVLINGSP